jgi:hypothetical protein
MYLQLVSVPRRSGSKPQSWVEGRRRGQNTGQANSVHAKSDKETDRFCVEAMEDVLQNVKEKATSFHVPKTTSLLGCKKPCPFDK